MDPDLCNLQQCLDKDVFVLTKLQSVSPALFPAELNLNNFKVYEFYLSKIKLICNFKLHRRKVCW